MNKVTAELTQVLEEIATQPLFASISDKILKACFLNLLNEENSLKGIDALLEATESDEDKDFIRESFNVLLLSIAEFRRKDLVETEIEVVLKEVGFTEEMTGKFLQRYLQFSQFVADKDNEKSNLFDSSINFNKLLDVEWNQEYVLSTKFIKHLNKDNYQIQLTTLDSRNQLAPINFKCSLEQMTELVSKLDAALRNIELATDLNHVKMES